MTEIGGRDGVGPEYAHHNRILLRNHPHYSERWLQERIVAQPSILGLGEVDVRAVERSQPAAGRLDLLLSDPSTETRYEVELQLGATNETHIIRTIEYWDIERKRYPQYDHVGVIVAEEITARFFNVISLFNGFIPSSPSSSMLSSSTGRSRSYSPRFWIESHSVLKRRRRQAR